MAEVDVLIPTCARSAALAVTLTSLLGQTYRDFRVVISDQTEGSPAWAAAEVQTPLRALNLHGNEALLLRNLPRRGLAQQRQFLLDQVEAPLAQFLDDDLLLEAGVLDRMVRAMRELVPGFVGCAPIGLSYRADVREHEQAIEFWEAGVTPECILPGTPAWQRHRLHNAANVFHVQDRLGLGSDDIKPYKVAWIGGCVLYDVAKLRDVGGFRFWHDLPPEHCGEDVLAQLLVMSRYGGCGILPSGVYHQELPTTVPDRRVNAPEALASLLTG